MPPPPPLSRRNATSTITPMRPPPPSVIGTPPGRAPAPPGTAVVLELRRVEAGVLAKAHVSIFQKSPSAHQWLAEAHRVAKWLSCSTILPATSLSSPVVGRGDRRRRRASCGRRRGRCLRPRRPLAAPHARPRRQGRRLGRRLARRLPWCRRDAVGARPARTRGCRHDHDASLPRLLVSTQGTRRAATPRTSRSPGSGAASRRPPRRRAPRPSGPGRGSPRRREREHPQPDA